MTPRELTAHTIFWLAAVAIVWMLTECTVKTVPGLVQALHQDYQIEEPRGKK